MHTDKESQMFIFLPGVQKQDYEFFHPLIFSDATLIFDGEDKVKDLKYTNLRLYQKKMIFHLFFHNLHLM